jgi:hypothetical protein
MSTGVRRRTLVTPSVSSMGTSNATEEAKGLAASSASVCTPVCTREGKPEQPDPLAALATVLLGLSPTDRARLATMLLGQVNNNFREGG